MTEGVRPARLEAGEVVCAAENVTLIRGDRKLLDRVSLNVHAGEILALLGPNGAGKSTLLGVLSGEHRPDGGSVRFRGKAISEWGLRELARNRGVLLQDHHLSFPFSVYEVVEMGRTPWLRTPLEDDDPEAISEAVADADISHLQARKVPSLSGGERARTSFARVLAARTQVLMLDEPTAALDLKHQEQVLRVVRDRARAGDAVVVVIHDVNLAAAFADRVALLRGGQLVTVGAPNEVLTAERVSEVYETPVEVFPHPVTGQGIILPVR